MVALGLVVLLLGIYGAELFLSRVSLVILLAGLVLCFGGWQFLKELRFALLVLLLAIPIPAIVFNRDNLPAADSGLKAGQRPASLIWCTGSARGQRHRASRR